MWKLKNFYYSLGPYLTHCKTVSYHFPCFADGLVLVYVGIFGGLLLLDLIHDGIDSKAEAGHAWQVTDGEVKLQRAVFPCVVWASAALAAHRRFAQQLCAVEEPRSHLDLGDVGMSKSSKDIVSYSSFAQFDIYLQASLLQLFQP